MSAIFCCTHPRSYSPTSDGAAALPVRPLSPPYGRQKTRKTRPGRRQSRQDIEAFYQEGKRLQKVEESRDSMSELSRGVISSRKVQELEVCPHIPRNSSSPQPSPRKTVTPPIRATSIPQNRTSDLNTHLVKLASPSPPQTPPLKLFSPPRTYSSEVPALMQRATLQLSHSGTNQIKQQAMQGRFYDEGNGSTELMRKANIGEDVEQNLDIEEVSTLYNNLEPGKKTTLDISQPISENCYPRPPTLSKMHINELVGQSDSSLSIDSINQDQTPIDRAWNTKGSCEIKTAPFSSFAGRDKTRVYLDSSSSYYTSNAPSFRSSIDLTISPVPLIPDGIIARMASRISSPGEVPMISMDNFLYGETEESPNSTHSPKTDGLKIDDERRAGRGSVKVGPALNHEKGVVGKGDLSSNTPSQKEEISEVKDHDSSVWDAGSTRRPLLTEAGKDLILVGDKKWDSSNDKLDKRNKTGMHKKDHSNGVITDNIKNWLGEHHKIRLSPMSKKKSRSMTFKRTFTKGMSKLRNRLSSNLKPAGTTGAMRHITTDGRGEFSRLHTPTESVITGRTAITDGYINVAAEDVTPDSEQVMANITFTPSLPTKFRLDGSLEDYDDFQNADLAVHGKVTSCSSPKLAPTVGCFTASRNAAVDQSRYSAIYDDCVIFPFSSDGDESGNEEESTPNPSLAMPCASPDCLETADVTHDVERRID